MLGGLPSYYHYSWEGASEEPLVQSVQSLLANSKDTILSNYIRQYNEALNLFQEQSGVSLSDEQSAVLDFAAEETLTQQDLEAALSSVVNKTPISGTDIGGGTGLVAAIQALNQKVTVTNKTLTNLSALMDAFTNATDLYKQVEESIVADGGNLRSKAKAKSTVVRQIVQNILNHPDGSEWNRGSKGYINGISGLSQRLNQWLVLLYALTTNRVPRGSKTAVKAAIIQTVKHDMNGLVTALGNVGTRVASAVATAQFVETLNSQIDVSKLKVSAHTSGGFIGHTIKIENNGAVQSLLSSVKSELSALSGMQGRVGDKLSIKLPKANVQANQQIWSDTLDANINNVTVKTTTSVRTLSSGSQRIGSITLQRSSPMLSLLIQELNLSSNNVIGLLQLAMAQNSSEPDSTWNDLREYTKKALLIPALTGLGTADFSNMNLATMIKINDYLIPMPQFLNYLQAMLTRQADVLGESFTGYISLEGFPSRSTFTKINAWQPPAQNNWIAAHRRSRLASSEGMGLLQSTKLRMRLRNLNLTMLIKAGSII